MLYVLFFIWRLYLYKSLWIIVQLLSFLDNHRCVWTSRASRRTWSWRTSWTQRLYWWNRWTWSTRTKGKEGKNIMHHLVRTATIYMTRLKLRGTFCIKNEKFRSSTLMSYLHFFSCKILWGIQIFQRLIQIKFAKWVILCVFNTTTSKYSISGHFSWESDITLLIFDIF